MGQVIAEIVGDRIQLTSNYSDKDLIRSCPGARWSKESGKWSLGRTWAACRQLRSVFGERLEIGPRLLEWAVSEVKTRIEPCFALREALEAQPVIPEAFPFQNAGARFMATAKQAALCDPMGAGKSLQTILAVRLLHEEHNDALPALVICPNSVKKTWKLEIERWWPGIPARIVEGTKNQKVKILANSSEGWTVINFEAVRLHSRLAPFGAMALTEEQKKSKELNKIDWGTVIVDESHRISDPRSLQTRACWALGRGLR